MSPIKESVVKARLDPDLASAFYRVCEADERTVSAVLRDLVERYVVGHEVIKKKISIEVTLGKPHGQGIIHNDEYEVTARLVGDVSDVNTREIRFLLPEFGTSDIEPYRLDSFYQHRAIFPRSRNQHGRLLGAKLIRNEWKGAVFLYDSSCKGASEAYFGVVKDALARQILSAVNQAIRGVSSELLDDGNQRGEGAWEAGQET